MDELVLGVGDVDDKGRISISRRFLGHNLLVICSSDFSRRDSCRGVIFCDIGGGLLYASF